MVDNDALAAVEGAEAAAGKESTKSAAQTIAAAITAGMKDSDQRKEAQAALDADQRLEALPVEKTGEDAGAEDVGAEETDTTVYDDAEMAEVEKVLKEIGLDIGVAAADLPAELRPAYAKIVQSVADLAERAMSQQLEASAQISAVNEFKTRLEQSPDRLLLSLAVTKPDAFKKAVEMFSTMEQDPRVKELVLRELEVEARQQETERRERGFTERERRTKANQVIGETRRAARIHGVDYALAEKVVALAVQANGGDLDVADVSDLVKDLRPATAQTKRIVTPTKAAAVKAAPTQSVDTGKGAGADLSPGLKEGGREKGGGRFRQLIGEAFSRVRSSES